MGEVADRAPPMDRMLRMQIGSLDNGNNGHGSQGRRLHTGLGTFRPPEFDPEKHSRKELLTMLTEVGIIEVKDVISPEGINAFKEGILTAFRESNEDWKERQGSRLIILLAWDSLSPC